MTSVNPSVAGQAGYTFPKHLESDHQKALHLLAQNFDTIAAQDGKANYVSEADIKAFVAQLQTVPGIETGVSLKLLEFGEKSSLYANADDPFSEQTQGLFAPDAATALNDISKADLAQMQAKQKGAGLFDWLFGNGSQTVGALEQQAKDNQATIAKNPEALTALMAQTQGKEEVAKAISHNIVTQLIAEQQQAQALAAQAASNPALGLSPEQMANLPIGDPLWMDGTGQHLWQSPQQSGGIPPAMGEVPWYDQVDPNDILNPDTPATNTATTPKASTPQATGTTITTGNNTNVNVFNGQGNPIGTQITEGGTLTINPDGRVTDSKGSSLTPPTTTPDNTNKPAPAPSTAGGQANHGVASIHAEGDVTVNIYNGDAATNPTALPNKDKPVTPNKGKADTPPITQPNTHKPATPADKSKPVTPPDTEPVSPGPDFEINQRENTISLAEGPSILLHQNTVDTLDKKASSTFETNDNTVGGHMVFASGDEVWAAQNQGLSVVHWNPRQALQEEGMTPTFKFYAAQPITINGTSKQGELSAEHYRAAIASDQLPKLTGLPAAFQSAYDKMLTP